MMQVMDVEKPRKILVLGPTEILVQELSTDLLVITVGRQDNFEVVDV